MAKLLFFDEGHKYELDGEPLPSVSELTRFISREVYGDVVQATLDRAAERGTAVHKATELLDKYGQAEIDESIIEYLNGYIAFRKEHKCNFEKIEFASYSTKYKYAGTVDRYGVLDGKKTLIDIKSSSAIQKKLYTAQLNLYKIMLEEQGLEVERMVILHLAKDKGYKLVEIDEDKELALACITLHNALKKKPRKKKGDK